MSRARSRFGNKHIVPDRASSAVIAIFAEHSTLLASSTIILTSNDRAPSRHSRQEIAMKRREFLQLSLGTAVVAALSHEVRAQADTKEIRVGYQKNGVLVIALQQAALEKHFAPQGIEVNWVSFSS